MSREFFEQIDDELRGLLGPALRDYRSVRSSRLLKLWYGDGPVHFEVQRVGPRWSPTKAPVLEVGLHCEHPRPVANDEVLHALQEAEPSWRPALPAAVAGRALGPMGAQWRRLSECLAETDHEDPDLASEAAEVMATYVRTLWPIIARLGDRPNPGDAAPPAVLS
ncbi:MAG TPA: hypothetical protein VFW71_09580 [Actinomycetota bacterium]|nr:hypothetical protein [Actinomycetota bacterium]